MANVNMITAQQVNAFAVQALQVSIFATSMGMMIAAMGAEALGMAPINVGVNDEAIASLRRTFGDTIIMEALSDFPTDEGYTPSIPELATRIEVHVKDDMIKKFGKGITKKAMAEAPPGDLITMIKIAQELAKAGIRGPMVNTTIPVSQPVGQLTGQLAGQKVTSFGSPVQYGQRPVIKPLIAGQTIPGQEVTGLTTQQIAQQVAQQQAVQAAVTRGIMAGRKPGKPVRDILTNAVYKSESEVGKLFGPQFGVPMTRINSNGETVPNTFAYYAVVKKAPGRFVHV